MIDPSILVESNIELRAKLKSEEGENSRGEPGQGGACSMRRPPALFKVQHEVQHDGGRTGKRPLGFGSSVRKRPFCKKQGVSGWI